MPEIARRLGAEGIVFLEGATRDAVIEELVRKVPLLENGKCAELFDAVLKREESYTTGIGEHLALPHAFTPFLKQFHLVLGLHAKGVSFAASDGKPVHVALLIVGPTNKKEEYQLLLKKSCEFLKSKREALMRVRFVDEVIELLADF